MGAISAGQAGHRVRNWLRMVAAMGAVMLGGCGNSASINYRFIVEVDDNGVTRSGSSVWQFKITENLDRTSYSPEFHGEAVAVDLPGRGTLFVLARALGSDMQIVAEKLFRPEAEAAAGRLSPRHELNRAIGRLTGAAKPVPCSQVAGAATPLSWARDFCPGMVRFRDPDDPVSVEGVKIGNLESAFGPGVRMKGFVVEITDADVTIGIEQLLKWLPDYARRRVNLSNKPGGPVGYDTPLAQRLGTGSFSTEMRIDVR